jgi:hypothetical protein
MFTAAVSVGVILLSVLNKLFPQIDVKRTGCAFAVSSAFVISRQTHVTVLT